MHRATAQISKADPRLNWWDIALAVVVFYDQPLRRRLADWTDWDKAAKLSEQNLSTRFW